MVKCIGSKTCSQQQSAAPAKQLPVSIVTCFPPTWDLFLWLFCRAPSTVLLAACFGGRFSWFSVATGRALSEPLSLCSTFSWFWKSLAALPCALLAPDMLPSNSSLPSASLTTIVEYLLTSEMSPQIWCVDKGIKYMDIIARLSLASTLPRKLKELFTIKTKLLRW